jgi:hypothetical protein
LIVGPRVENSSKIRGCGVSEEAKLKGSSFLKFTLKIFLYLALYSIFYFAFRYFEAPNYFIFFFILLLTKGLIKEELQGKVDSLRYKLEDSRHDRISDGVHKVNLKLIGLSNSPSQLERINKKLDKLLLKDSNLNSHLISKIRELNSEMHNLNLTMDYIQKRLRESELTPEEKLTNAEINLLRGI